MTIRDYADDGYREVRRAIAAGETDLARSLLAFLRLRLELLACRVCGSPSVNGSRRCRLHPAPQRTGQGASQQSWDPAVYG